MDLAMTFVPLLQVFTAEMTQPAADTFRTLIAGWVFAPRRTILGMVRSSRTDRHHAAFHRLFSDSPWSIDRVGLAVFDLVVAGMQTVFLCCDDTLLARSGLKVFGTGMLATRCSPAAVTPSPAGGSAGWFCAWSSRAAGCLAGASPCR